MLEKPKDPVKWPAYGFYFKPVLLVLNVIPYAIFLIFFARALDRYAANDWAWFFGLVAAAFGTYLLPYTQTLNNHTIGAFGAFFAVYHFLRIWDDGSAPAGGSRRPASSPGFTASTELPALSLPALLGPMLMTRYPAADAPLLPARGDHPAGRPRRGAIRRIRQLVLFPV